MKTIQELIGNAPKQLTHSQVNSLQKYLQEHPEMEIRSIWYDCLSDCLMIEFSQFTMGIERDGYAHS
jgi:hypothetical protein